LCYDVTVHLSVTEVHWRIIANLCFKFRSHLPRIAGAVLFAVLLAGGSSRAMLASARVSCYYSQTTVDYGNYRNLCSIIDMYWILRDLDL